MWRPSQKIKKSFFLNNTVITKFWNKDDCECFERRKKKRDQNTQKFLREKNEKKSLFFFFFCQDDKENIFLKNQRARFRRRLLSLGNGQTI